MLKKIGRITILTTREHIAYYDIATRLGQISAESKETFDPNTISYD